MKKQNNTLYGYLLRLPGFLAVHVISLLVYRALRPQEFLGMFLMYHLMLLTDMYFRKLSASVAAALGLCILCLVTGFYGGIAAVVFAFVYRPEAYHRAQIIAWVAYYLIVGALFSASLGNDSIGPLFAEVYPGGLMLCCVYMFVMALALLVCRQGQCVRTFSRAYYCRESPRATVREVYRRTEGFVIPLLLCVALAGAFAVLQDYGAINNWVTMDRGLKAKVVGFYDPDSEEEKEEEQTPEFRVIREEAEETAAESSNLRLIIGACVGGVCLAILIFLLFRRKRRELDEFDEFDDSVEELAAEGLHRTIKPARAATRGLNARVRRMFANKVRKYSKRRLITAVSGDTPLTLAGKIAETENILPLAELYHKARYSGAEVTKEDMAELR